MIHAHVHLIIDVFLILGGFMRLWTELPRELPSIICIDWWEKTTFGELGTLTNVLLDVGVDRRAYILLNWVKAKICLTEVTIGTFYGFWQHAFLLELGQFWIALVRLIVYSSWIVHALLMTMPLIERIFPRCISNSGWACISLVVEVTLDLLILLGPFTRVLVLECILVEVDWFEIVFIARVGTLFYMVIC